MNKGKIVTKLIFVFFLAFLFSYLFGFQSIKRFTEKNTFTEKSTISSDFIRPPAMTICNLEAWKKIQSEEKRTFAFACGNRSDVYQCVEEKTFSRQQTLEKPRIGKGKSVRSLVDDKFWVEDISYVKKGKCHRLKYDQKIGTNYSNDVIAFKKHRVAIAEVFIHDPEYFVMTFNLAAIPHIKYDLGNDVNSFGLQSKKDTILIISVTQHMNLNKPERPCKSSSYDFTLCVKTSIASKIGCKPSWDVIISNRLANCETMEQLKHYEAYFDSLYNMEQKDIFKTSGCSPPCEYREYKVVDTKVKIKGMGLFGFILASTDILVETEAYTYPWVSLLAEFGGALGLFLGFSFIMVWDVLEWMFSFFISGNKPVNIGEPE